MVRSEADDRLIRFRRATLDDVGRVAQIHVAAWKATYTGLVDQAALDARTVDKRVDQWTEVLSGRQWLDHLVYVAEVDDRIEGFARVGPSDDPDVDRATTLNVFALYLDPEERGRGLGTALLDHVLEEATAAGYRLATLYVLIDNVAARRFYERRGWQPEPEVVTECLGDGTEAPQLRYRLELV